MAEGEEEAPAQDLSRAGRVAVPAPAGSAGDRGAGRHPRPRSAGVEGDGVRARAASTTWRTSPTTCASRRACFRACTATSGGAAGSSTSTSRSCTSRSIRTRTRSRTGTSSPFIVLTSGLIDLLGDEELSFVVGHELGHIKAGHVLYTVLARNIASIIVGARTGDAGDRIADRPGPGVRAARLVPQGRADRGPRRIAVRPESRSLPDRLHEAGRRREPVVGGDGSRTSSSARSRNTRKRTGRA